MSKRRVRLISESVLESYIDSLRELPLDGSHEALYREFKSTRSIEQNSLLHTLLGEMANYTGDSIDSMKYDMKVEFLVPISEKVRSDGRIQVEYKSTAKMKVKELSEFYEKVEAFAAMNLGITLPPRGCDER